MYHTVLLYHIINCLNLFAQKNILIRDQPDKTFIVLYGILAALNKTKSGYRILKLFDNDFLWLIDAFRQMYVA